MQTNKNRAGRALVFLAALLFAAGGCLPPGPRAVLEGKKLLDRGEYTAAVAKLQSAVSILNTNAQAWNYLGLAYHHSGKPDEAQKAYQRALRLDNDLTEARFNLGCLWLEQTKLDWAKTEFTAFTMRRPAAVEGHLKLGTTLLRLRDPVAAEKSFGDALKLSPQNAEALTGLGLARVQRNRPAEAAQQFAAALKVEPGYRPALLNYAIVAQQQLRDNTLALQKYREYLAAGPPPADAEAIKAVVKQLEPDQPPPTVTTLPAPAAAVSLTATPRASPPPAKAVVSNSTPRQVASLTRPEPPPAPPRTQLVVKAEPPATRLTAPRPDSQAAAVRTPATKASPPPPAATVPTEVVALPAEPVIKSAGEPASTLAAPRSTSPAAAPNTAAATPPATNPPRKSFLQRINPAKLFTRSQTTETVRLASVPGTQQVASTDGGVPHVSPSARYAYKSPPAPRAGDRAGAERAFAQGWQAHQAHRLPEAIQAYRRAVQLDPAYFDAHYNLGLAAQQAGNIEQALTAYEYALASNPRSLDARYNFALILRQIGYSTDAARELEKVLGQYPNESRAHLALGNLYAQQLQQPAKAREHYLKVLENDPRNPQAGAIRYWLADHPQ